MAMFGKEEVKVQAEALKMAGIDFDTTGDTMAGFEQINGETMSVPFVRILQKLSPQLNKQKPEFISGAEEGDFFNTTTKYITKSMNIVILKYEHIYIEWKPNRGGFVSYHTPENAQRLTIDNTFGNWKTKEGNLLQENYVYMILVEGKEHEGPCVLSMTSSAIKVAKELNRLMITHVMDNGVQAKPYYLVWNLASEYKKNDKGDWYQSVFKFVKYINEQQYNITKRERLALPSRQVDYAQIEHKQADADDDTTF